MSDSSNQILSFTDMVGVVFTILKSLDWLIFIILAIALFFVLKNTWLTYIRQKYIKKFEFDILEIRVPNLIEKGPRAMELFFSNLSALRGGARDKREAYMSGTLPHRFSFEVVGSGGKVALYMCVPKKVSANVESALYAQYPDIEVQHVEDYMNKFPEKYDGFEALNIDFLGTEFVLDNNPAFPLMTFDDLESREGTERIVDPISVLIETLSRLKDTETVWLQLVVRPATSEWVKSAQEEIEKLKKKSMPERDSEGKMISPGGISPGEKDLLKNMERKISKPGFETAIRWAHFGSKSDFAPNLGNITSYFSQFDVGGGNKIRVFGETFAAADWQHWPFFYPKARAFKKKVQLLKRFRDRRLAFTEGGPFSMGINEKISVLTSEELATLFHPPTNVVLTATTLNRVESKTVTPPAFLPY